MSTASEAKVDENVIGKLFWKGEVRVPCALFSIV
jgi:hypothetical protein